MNTNDQGEIPGEFTEWALSFIASDRFAQTLLFISAPYDLE